MSVGRESTGHGSDQRSSGHDADSVRAQLLVTRTVVVIMLFTQL